MMNEFREALREGIEYTFEKSRIDLADEIEILVRDLELEYDLEDGDLQVIGSRVYYNGELLYNDRE